MYTTFEIKMKIFNKMTIEDIINISKLNYGIMSDIYTLKLNETGIYNILFDLNRVSRGIEIKIEKRTISLTMGYPNTEYEINLFYDLIDKILKKQKTKYFYKEKKKQNIFKKEEYINSDLELSVDMLKKIEQKVLLGIKKNEMFLGAINPIFLGKKEFEYIDSSLKNFEDLVHEYQTKRLSISEPELYKRTNETIYAIFNINEEYKTIIRKNVSTYPLKYYVNDYYICLGGINYIKYSDFIENIGNYEYYDDESIIVKINSEDVFRLIENRCLDINTNQNLDSVFFGKWLDDVFYHKRKIYQNNFDLDPLVGCNHLAAFFRYFYEKDLLDEKFLKYIPEIKEVIKNDDLRKYMETNRYIQGMIRIGYFKEEIRDFILSYYSFLDSKLKYPIRVDEISIAYFGEERYNSDEMKTDGYLFIPYDEEYYNSLKKYIDQDYEEYVNSKKNNSL